MNRDEKYMKRALALAAKAKGGTSPNPMVGAVIVKGGKIVAEGYHRRAGEDHGEIIALKRAGLKARGAELFLNLEPCSHFGRTPPCAPEVARYGIKRVVAGMVDPNPKVAGKGIALLRSKGVEVEVGVLEAECRKLNEVFIHWITKNRPFCILKAAMSLDGKIATRTGNSKWITGEDSRRDVHKWRAEVDAIIVGAGTVRIDDPQLTAREVAAHKQPVPVIISGALDLPRVRKIYNHPAGCIIVHAKKAPKAKLEYFAKKNIELLEIDFFKGEMNWNDLLEKLAAKKITSVLIEGGADIFGSAVDAEIVNKVVLYYAPIIIGGEKSKCAFGKNGAALVKDAAKLGDMSIEKIGADFKVTGYMK